MVEEAEFHKYISNRYGVKGRRSIRFSSSLNELEILLGIKDESKIDDDDKRYLNEKQLKELENMKNKHKM